MSRRWNNAVVAIPNKEKQQKNRGYYLHSEFIYNKESDTFTCPNQQILTKSNSVITKENGTKSYVYRAGSKTCNACSLRDKCIVTDSLLVFEFTISEYHK